MAAPILWTDRNYAATIQRPATRWNAKGEREPVLTDDGERAVERIPQTGRVGAVREVDDIKNTRPMPDPRSVFVLRDDGHELHVPIRSAAASGHGEQGTDNSMVRYQLAKAKKKGWVVNEACPATLVLHRERRIEQMKSEAVRAAVAKKEGCGPRDPKSPPCAHYLAERDARQARRLNEHERQVDRGRTQADRTTDALVQFVEKMVPAGTQPSAPPVDQEFAPRKGGK